MGSLFGIALGPGAAILAEFLGLLLQLPAPVYRRPGVDHDPLCGRERFLEPVLKAVVP
jgi:hypothetical protein